ncbi:hypothetical protein GIB67_040417 [Kingdonia uniflora]|uniref:J domain-containing protein n=1 Tax=Kingdonia uniflora TaxID=39325 RepID=A0A7J7KXM8_9MAGN|nr:hypothetical protein GIB67_040417 [Kingdonia uniflora]
MLRSLFYCRASASGISLYSNSRNSSYFQSVRSFSRCPCMVSCKKSEGGDHEKLMTRSSASNVLGVKLNCSLVELKSAFRSKVKQFHPDIYHMDVGDSDQMIRRVLQAYEILSTNSSPESSEREPLDPFDDPECEAFDLFVNETLCAGKGCFDSCVAAAPYAFFFASPTDTARATSQVLTCKYAACVGYGNGYEVHIAVGQCPRNCIHYVTPCQRVILEELLDGILSAPYNGLVEADYMYSLIIKAEFENNRYQKPKKQPESPTQNVDWF